MSIELLQFSSFELSSTINMMMMAWRSSNAHLCISAKLLVLVVMEAFTVVLSCNGTNHPDQFRHSI